MSSRSRVARVLPSIATSATADTSPRRASLHLLEANGFERVRVRRAGFPFFDLYRLVVIARGKRLIADVEQPSDTALDGGASGAALRLFDRLFRYNLDSSPFGWQLPAEAYRLEVTTQ